MPTDILRSSRRLRRKKALIKAALAVVGVFVLLISIIALFYIPKFRINNISVEGAKILERDSLGGEAAKFLKGKFFGIIPYDNILILPKKKLADFIYDRFPLIEKIAISRNFPQGLSVLVDERKPEALWCRGYMEVRPPMEVEPPQSPQTMECAFMSEDGFIFQTAPFFSGNIFLKFFDQRGNHSAVGKFIMDAAEFGKLLIFYKTLSEKKFDVISIILKGSDIYEVNLKEGWRIILNNKNDPDISFGSLEIVLNENIKEKRPKLDYIDIRFGNKIFYKLK